MLLLSVLCLVLGSACAKIDYENYHAIVAGPLKTKHDLQVIDLLRDEDSRSRKVNVTIVDDDVTHDCHNVKFY